MHVHIKQVSGSAILRNAFFHDMANIRLQVYNFGVESFTDGWIRKQCNLANRFPNVFVRGLNLAKNRPTSLIWTDFFFIQSKKDGKDQESIQSSTTPDPGYQWESNKLTVRHHKRELRGQDNLQIYYSSASATVLSNDTEPWWKNAVWIESPA